MTVDEQRLREELPRRCSCTYEAGDSDCAEHPRCVACNHPMVDTMLTREREELRRRLTSILDELAKVRALALEACDLAWQALPNVPTDMSDEVARVEAIRAEVTRG